MSKFIVTAALTGAIHTPTMSPYLPITPDEIAEDARRAGEAGAAVVHVHARDPETGQPSADSSLFGEILSKIKEIRSVLAKKLDMPWEMVRRILPGEVWPPSCLYFTPMCSD